jgi:protein O-GlcNAc transferase
LLDDALVRAHQFYNGGRFEQARQICELIRDEAPMRTDNLLLLGAIYYQSHNLLAAIDANRTALGINPQLAEVSVSTHFQLFCLFCFSDLTRVPLGVR